MVGVSHGAPEFPQGLAGGHVEIFGPSHGEPIDEGLRRHERVLLMQADVVCHCWKVPRINGGETPKDNSIRSLPPIVGKVGT